MKSSKGQALVEFIVSLPILLLILLSMIDFGNIIYKRYNLESSLDTIVDLYKTNRGLELERYLLDEKIDIDYQIEDKLSKKELNNVLFVGTGALLSPTSSLQKESTPGIAHGVLLTSNNEKENKKKEGEYYGFHKKRNLRKNI